MDTGEKELEYALPWDTIQPVYYKSNKGFDDILPNLIKASENRRKNNSEFQTFLKQRDRLEKRYSSKVVSLLLTNRLAEAEIEAELDKVLENEYLDEEEKISVSPKNLSDADLMLNETLLILGDWLDNISTNKISNEETVITQID